MTNDDEVRIAGPSAYPVLLALLAAALFGAIAPAGKALLHDVSPLPLAGLLYLGGMLGVAPVALRRKSFLLPWRMDRRNLGRLAGAVLFGGVVGPVLLLLSLRLASAASVSMWLNLELVATALLGWFVFRDHLGAYGWVGLAGIVAAGIILATNEGQAGLAAGLLATGACLCWGLDNHLTALIDNITPAQSTFWKALVAGSVNLALGLITGGTFGSMSAIAGSLVVGAFAVGISIALYISAAQSLGATRGQMLFASAPFFGLLLSALLLGETISTLQVVATVLMAGSLLVLFRDRHSHRHSHSAVEHEHWHRHDDGHHDHVHEGLSTDTSHSHLHSHRPVAHTHPHWPDLHHRHDHDNDREN